MLKNWSFPIGALVIAILLAVLSSKIERVCQFIDATNWEFVVAMVAIVVSVYAVHTQQEHNKLSYKPIPQLVEYNYTNRVKVLLWNKGAGPLFIESFRIGDKESLIEFVPQETREFSYVEFFQALKGRVVSPDCSLNLLEFNIRDDEDGEAIAGYAEALLQIKKALHGMVIYLEYKNIYDDTMEYASEVMDFANLENDDRTAEEIKAGLEEMKILPDQVAT